jgi:hypothetical protein
MLIVIIMVIMVASLLCAYETFFFFYVSVNKFLSNSRVVQINGANGEWRMLFCEMRRYESCDQVGEFLSTLTNLR